MRLLHLVVLSIAAAALSACSDDTAPSYTVDMALSDTSLAADGSNGATLSITVLDEDGGDPPPVASQVLVRCQDSDGEAAMWISSGDEVGQALVRLDGLGIGSESIRCSGDDGEDYQVQCLAVYEGVTGFLGPFTCSTSVAD